MLDVFSRISLTRHVDYRFLFASVWLPETAITATQSI